MRKFKNIEELNDYLRDEFGCEDIEQFVQDYKSAVETLRYIYSILDNDVIELIYR